MVQEMDNLRGRKKQVRIGGCNRAMDSMQLGEQWLMKTGQQTSALCHTAAGHALQAGGYIIQSYLLFIIIRYNLLHIHYLMRQAMAQDDTHHAL